MNVKEKLKVRRKHLANELCIAEDHYSTAVSNLKQAVYEGKTEIIQDICKTLQSLKVKVQLLVHRIEMIEKAVD